MGIQIGAYSSAAGLASGATVALPTVKDGSEVWLICTSDSASPNFTTPSGWTVVRASANIAVAGGNDWIVAIYRKTWNTGDPTTVTISGPATNKAHMVALTSDFATPSSWTRVAGAMQETDSAALVVVKQTTPTDATYDARLIFVVSQASGNYLGTASSGQPVLETGGLLYDMAIRSAQDGGTQPYTQIHAGIGPQSFDSADGSILLSNASSRVLTFPFDISDGGGDYYDGAEYAPERELDAAVGMWGLASATGSDSSANARWEGGGPRLLA